MVLRSGEGLPPPCQLWLGKERHDTTLRPKATGAQCDYRPSILGVNDLGGQEERGLQGRKQRVDWTHLKDKGWDGQGGAQCSDTAEPMVIICSHMAVWRGLELPEAGPYPDA